jgi:hypothetical protein
MNTLGERSDINGDDSNSTRNPTLHGDSNSTMQIQAAIGVLVLSVAAAAVIWRVKPE